MDAQRTPDLDIGEPGTDPVADRLTAARLYTRAIERGDDVTAEQSAAILARLPELHDTLTAAEVSLTDHLVSTHRWSWGDIANLTGRTSRQAAYNRYTRIGGTRANRAIDDISAPDADITPPELTAEALARDGAPWWAEAAATPAEVTDWDDRLRSAWIPYGLVGGMPVNPHGPTGRIGRNLPRWGENQAADAIVIAGTGSDRRILLIQRDDTGTWALPGGMVDTGEDDTTAMARELHEEAGLDLTWMAPQVVTTTYVEDHRASDHAWVVTTAGMWRIPESADVAAGDDAADAAWWPAADMPALREAIQSTGGHLHQAHAALIAAALDSADDIETHH